MTRRAKEIVTRKDLVANRASKPMAHRRTRLKKKYAAHTTNAAVTKIHAAGRLTVAAKTNILPPKIQSVANNAQLQNTVKLAQTAL